MNNVERFRKVLNFETIDRLPMVEWASWWNETIDRWYEQGLPRELDTINKISDYFGLDSLKQFWFKVRSDDCPKPEYHGAPIINSPEDYNKLVEKGKLFGDYAFEKTDLSNWLERINSGDTVLWITLEGFFWFPRTLFGIENHMYAFYDYPELMHKMNHDLTEHWLRQIDKFTEISTPVFATIAEDMSYNHGPMLSKTQFDEFFAPYYKRIVPALKDKGIKVFVDSDGDIEPLIPWLKEVGVEGLLPLERMAGVDVNNIRKKHPDFLMLGAFDKTIMHKGQQALEAEFQRLLPAMKSGGFIPSVDHQTPPAVTVEDYRLYLEMHKKHGKLG
ncbi:MAG: uroporphyrinogen decarboxylase family protein [Sedimentisphaeraceae bacterium JB056]